ncbi:hypothetical protein IV203_003190 [Nitzschia inconspicua]|uniref:RNI-like protein n=1 Tax=Nitzschia inconspicua TaxID=303405 RepID=A0A9K3L2Z8_9STRA|nr:hypothetical protein IV203_003190 [Nitzschia inconspicua]
MPRRSNRNNAAVAGGDESAAAADAGAPPPPQQQQGNNHSVAAHVRERQRAVAEREAARLARPEQRRTKTLQHADKRKSAVTSTPFGVLPKNSRDIDPNQEEEWCGPFSVARQIIAQREEAKRKREEEEANSEEHHPLDALMDQVAAEQQRKAHPSLLWKSNLMKQQENEADANANLYAKRQKRVDISNQGRSQVPSLFHLCVQFVVNNFEYVESLGDVDHDVRLAIMKELITRNQLDSKAFEALQEPSLEILEVPDCIGIPQDVMANALKTMPNLRYLLLTHAGRCLGPKAVQEFLQHNTASQLSCLSIAGAYLLKDEDAARIIKKHAGSLQSISFQCCPLLGPKLLQALQLHMATGTLLELSLQDMSFPSEQLKAMASCQEIWKNVKSITLKSVGGLNDEILSQILAATGDVLDSLNVSDNYELTDATLSSIRQFNPRLKTLVMNGIKELTAAGLEAMFTHPLPGLPPPPRLKVLKLSSVDHQAVTDEVMRLVTAGASAQDITNEDDIAATSPPLRRSAGGGLVQLDIQGSTLVTDTMLEQLVETSANSLEDLNISYCPKISDQGLGYLVSRMGPQLVNLQVWGCAQLTDDFFDGHDRVKDGTLQIVGAWMKKSGTRSLR